MEQHTHDLLCLPFFTRCSSFTRQCVLGLHFLSRPNDIYDLTLERARCRPTFFGELLRVLGTCYHYYKWDSFPDHFIFNILFIYYPWVCVSIWTHVPWHLCRGKGQGSAVSSSCCGCQGLNVGMGHVMWSECFCSRSISWALVPHSNKTPLLKNRNS